MSEQMHLLSWGVDPRWVKAALPSVLRALCSLPWPLIPHLTQVGGGIILSRPGE